MFVVVVGCGCGAGCSCAVEDVGSTFATAGSDSMSNVVVPFVILRLFPATYVDDVDESKVHGANISLFTTPPCEFE